MMSVIKKLPITKSPIVGLQYLAIPLSIILNYDECYPWFYSNYIQLVWTKDLNSRLKFYIPTTEKGLDMDQIPWLNTQIIEKNVLFLNNIDIISFIINSIDNEYYVYSFFDEYYVPKKSSYKVNHYLHDFLIIGYDSSEELIYILGYSDKGIYETTKISFEQFKEAFMSSWENVDMQRYKNEVRLLKKRNNFKYEFDLKNVYCQLKEYYLKTDSSEMLRMNERPNVNRVYGIEIYQILRKYFELLIDKKIPNDFRPVHILYEHKKCMVMRLEYMVSNGHLQDDKEILPLYNSIEKYTLEVRNLQIKYMMNNNPKTLIKIIDKLDEIESLEKLALEALLKDIEKVL